MRFAMILAGGNCHRLGAPRGKVARLAEYGPVAGLAAGVRRALGRFAFATR